MKKTIISGILVLLLWTCSQVLLSLLYNPQAEYIMGIKNTIRIKKSIPEGYIQKQQTHYSNGKPYPIQEDIFSITNALCPYGIGKCQLFAFQYLLSSIEWLSTIQFIGKNVITSAPSDVSNRLISVSRLSPYRAYPYIFGNIIGPTSNREAQEQNNAILSRKNTIQLGESGIQYLCDGDKINKISALSYLEFIRAVENKDPTLRNPCIDYRLAHTLAFNYFYYLDNSEKASLYYKVASFHDDVPSITLAMPAIIIGKDGNNLTSASLWYDRLQNSLQELKKKGITIQDDDRQQLISSSQKSQKKAVSEISLYILSKTYPDGTDNIKIGKSNIQRTIKNILSDCKNQRIACELIGIGLQNQRIYRDGTLTYPLDDKIDYHWDTKKKQRDFKSKSE